MQLDFHYYCVGALARMSGFLPKHALTIAYASQYVDNATESEPVRVGGIGFDPVRTAHMGLTSFTWDVQKKIYMPFHFIPPYPVNSVDASFLTAPGSRFCHESLGKGNFGNGWFDAAVFHRHRAAHDR